MSHPTKPGTYRKLLMQQHVLECELLDARKAMDRDGNTPELALRVRDLRRERRAVQIQIRYEKEKNPYLDVPRDTAFSFHFYRLAREMLEPDEFDMIYRATKAKFPS